MKYAVLSALLALPLLATPAMAQYNGPPQYYGPHYMRAPRAMPVRSPYCKIKSEGWRDSWQQYYHCWQ